MTHTNATCLRETRGISRAMITALFALTIIFSASSALAQNQPNASSPAELYTGETSNSKSALDYRPMDAILGDLVWVVGPSNRKAAPKARANAGSRFSTANNSKTRYEANRVFYHLMEDGDLEAISNFRRDLESIPGWVDMARLNKDEQLAYWLNLYNIALIEQIAMVYPITDLGRLRRDGLWDKKILTVRGLPLSLNDIHHKVLANWDNDLVIYGLFQGTIGGPNIRAASYRGTIIWDQLADNAKDFIGALRGTQFSNQTAIVSEYYDWNSSRFPTAPELMTHLREYAPAAVASRLAATNELERTFFDHNIADLMNGRLGGSSVTTGGGAQLAMAGGSAGAFPAHLLGKGGSLPPHAVELLSAIGERNREREANVDAADVTEGKNN